MKKVLWIRVLLILVSLAILLSALCAFSAYQSAHTLIVTNYELSAPIQNPLRLVQLTDLHCSTFGENNQQIVDIIRELDPDLILMTGDMVNGDGEEIGVVLSLIEQLQELAPVYFGYGNHETDWEKNFGSLRPSLEKAGAIVLDTEYVDVEHGGNALRIGGYAGYYRAPVMTTSDRGQRELELQFADDFENTDRFTILLSHIPTAWLDWEHRDQYPVDLVFCGHYHGGQIRLPLIGGLLAPNIGFFPPYTKGVFPGKTATVVLSAGLGSERNFPRINNPGEIVCVDLVPEK